MALTFLSCAGQTAETSETVTEPTTGYATETEEITETEIQTETETEEVTEQQIPEEKGTVELYQLAPEGMSLMMSYVIVTPNKQIVVIDGGIDGSGVEAKPYLPNAIRAILGLNENDPFEVEAWFLSHAHRDHFYELAKMLNEYTAESNYRINNFYFDYPDIGVEWDSAAGSGDYDLERLGKLKKGFDNYYSINKFTGIKGAEIPEDKFTAPEGEENYYYDLINGAVINEEAVEQGLTVTVDGVEFRIMMTWWKEARYVNSTSVIIKMSFDGQSVLFLGDAHEDSGKRLLQMYDAEELKADYVQMSHHGQGGTDQAFYDAIDAEKSIRLWPTPSWVWNDAKTYAIGKTRSWLGLPVEAADFKKAGLLETGFDFVAGLYRRYPSQGHKFEKWTQKVLDAQRVAVLGKAE